MQRVVIEVHGGVADCIEKPEGVRVIIHDCDNEKATPEGEQYEPQVYEEGEVVE